MKYNYGTCVELYTLYRSNWYIFLPMCYPWEEEAKQAIIRLDKKHTLEGNVGAKLLIVGLAPRFNLGGLVGIDGEESRHR